MNSLNPSYNLPPIRKIGPAVLPKPKNIKIQAGRVIRLEQPDSNNFQKLDFDSNQSDFVLDEDADYDGADDNATSDAIATKSLLNVNTPPHRAKLVQIPNNTTIPGHSALSAETSPQILLTSQFKFPRKTSAERSESNQAKPSSTTVPLSSYINRTSPSSPPSNYSKNDIPIHITQTYSPTHKIPKTYLKTNNTSDNSTKASTINFSSDGTTNRPTITITTNNNRNNPGNVFQIQPQVQFESQNHRTAPKTASSSSSSEGFSYNIPIQYTNSKQKTAQQQPSPNYNQSSPRHNFVVPVETNNTSAKSPSNFLGYNNSNSTSYTLPVNVSLSQHQHEHHHTDSDDSGDNESNYKATGNNNNNNNNSSSSNSNHIQPQISNNYSPISSFINNSSINQNNGLRISEKPKSNNSIDEVDLLKDLLMKNLNASSDPNFFGMCMKCNDKIYGADNGLRAMDQLFHVACFACQGCGIGLQNKHFYAMEKKSFCEGCYMKLLEKCTLCSRSITDRILRATGKPFHPECFNCTVCTKNLDGIPFTVDSSNKIHCISCFHDKYAPRCYICQQSIVPEPGNEETIRIVAMDKSFHVHCYKCEDCGVSLSSNAENVGGCFPLDDHILCKGCNINRIRNLVTNHDLQSDMYANQKLLRNMLNSSSSPNNQQQQSSNYNARSTDL